MRTDDVTRDDEPPWPDDDAGRNAPYVDGAWGRTANPNTADGELQNIAAFGLGLTRLSGARRVLAKTVVVLILLGIAVTLGFGVVGIVRIW